MIPRRAVWLVASGVYLAVSAGRTLERLEAADPRLAPPKGIATLQLSAVTLNPTSVIGGATIAGTVTLPQPAPSGGVTVTIRSSQPTVAAVPSSLVVQPGATAATFVVQTYPVATYPNVVAEISAQAGTSTKAATLTVLPPTLASLTLKPASVAGGSSSTGTVMITGPAPSGGLAVTLSSQTPTAAGVPQQVTIAAGATGATFSVATKGVAAATSVSIVAAQWVPGPRGPQIASSKTAPLTVLPSKAAAGAPSAQQRPLQAPGGPSGGLSSSSSAVTASGANPYITIDRTVSQNSAGSWVDVYIGNTGQLDSNYNFTANLAVSSGRGQAVCSTGTNVYGLQHSTQMKLLRFQVTPPPTSATSFGGALKSAVPVPYTLSANLRFWQQPTGDPTADLNPQDDYDQATLTLPPGPVACVLASAPQSVSIGPGPIPGGQNSIGTVTLAGTIVPVTVHLASDKPGVATVPATVPVQSGSSATFTVTTLPVSTPTDATISAYIQDPSAFVTARLTVRPPHLSLLACSPTQLPSGTPIHCTVGLDGRLPGVPIQQVTPPVPGRGGVQVQITTNKPAVASPPPVVVGPGTDRANFDIPTVADAQGGPITVFAAYQGVTKSATVQLTAAVIKDFGCFVGAPGPSTQGTSTCTINPWSGGPYGLIVHLAQATAEQVTIPVAEPGRLHHASIEWRPLEIAAGQTSGQVVSSDSAGPWFSSYFEPVPATENHTIEVRDPVSGTTLTTTFTVRPARIVQIGFGDTLSAAQNPATISSALGQKVKVWVSFNAPPAPTDWFSQNAWLDVRYGGGVDIQGPTNVAIQEQVCSYPTDLGQCTWWNLLSYMTFEIPLGACSAAVHPNGCQATVSVSSNQALGTATGTINVTPQ